ncbi:MAG: type II toxin-antitoxin system VapC family toxin [Acidobacteria bacterium]|nr:type II toxin-antitoxin system VapC family toxin [Acidobacteriota bacterium]
MRILIDTHILIWHLEDDKRLTAQHGNIIEDSNNRVFVSVASLWEIAIKTSRGKLSLSRPIEDIFSEIERSTSSILLIKANHSLHVSKLIFHHNDPFDRMIIAQALVEGLPVMSTDKNFAAYGVTLL